MIEQQGRVTGVSGNRVRVRLGGTSGCSACDAGRGCGAGIFGRLLKRRPVEIEFENHIGAMDGQAVMVGLSESLFLEWVTRLYLLPLLSGLAGAFLGHYVADQISESGAVMDLCALAAGMTAAWLLLRRKGNSKNELMGESTVHLLRILNPRDRGPEQSIHTR